jgi:hypothetical protein
VRCPAAAEETSVNPALEETSDEHPVEDAGDMEATAANALLNTTPSAPREPINAGKVRLDCPECGNHGFFDLNRLNKLIRCPGCNSVWRLEGVNGMVKVGTVDPDMEVEVQADTGGWVKQKVPAGAAETEADTTSPGAGKASKRSRLLPKKPAGRKSRAWVSGFTVGARALLSNHHFLAAVGLALVVGVLWSLQALIPSQLKSRSREVARAWLARDTEGVKKFTEAPLAGKVDSWMKQNPPPDLSKGPAPLVSVSVDRNDGRSAEVTIQIKKLDDKGSAKHYVYRQRWANRDDGWVFSPDVRTVSLADEL